jgi:hypothetical protein
MATVSGGAVGVGRRAGDGRILKRCNNYSPMYISQ